MTSVSTNKDNKNSNHISIIQPSLHISLKQHTHVKIQEPTKGKLKSQDKMNFHHQFNTI